MFLLVRHDFDSFSKNQRMVGKEGRKVGDGVNTEGPCLLTVKVAQWDRPCKQKLQGQRSHKQCMTWRSRSVYLHSACAMYMVLV